MCRVWNWEKFAKYKGKLIKEKATGKPASSSSARNKSEGEKSEREESDEDEAAAAAAMVEALELKWSGFVVAWWA